MNEIEDAIVYKFGRGYSCTNTCIERTMYSWFLRECNKAEADLLNGDSAARLLALRVDGRNTEIRAEKMI